MFIISKWNWLTYNEIMNYKTHFLNIKIKIDYYNTYITKENFSNLRNLAKKVLREFGSSYTCESFFSKKEFSKHKVTVNIPKICKFIMLIHLYNCAQLQLSSLYIGGDIRWQNLGAIHLLHILNCFISSPLSVFFLQIWTFIVLNYFYDWAQFHLSICIFIGDITW